MFIQKAFYVQVLQAQAIKNLVREIRAQELGCVSLIFYGSAAAFSAFEVKGSLGDYHGRKPEVIVHLLCTTFCHTETG